MADELVLAADVVANEEVDVPGFDAPQTQRVVLAQRGDPLPSSLADQQDEFIAEGLLVPSDYLRLKEDPELQAALSSGDPDALAAATQSVLALIEATGNEAAGVGTGIQALPPSAPEEEPAAPAATRTATKTTTADKK